MVFPKHLAVGHFLAEELPDSRQFLRNWHSIFQDYGHSHPTVLANAVFWVENTSKPWIALNHLDRFLDSLFDPSSLFDFLEHYPSAFEVLWNALSKTPYLAELLTRNPEDFYWLVEEAALGQTVSQSQLQRQFEETVFTFESPYRQHSFLHRLHRRHFLRIALRDLMGIASFEHTVRDLGALAETLVRIVTQMVQSKFEAKERLPESRFTVIALGKLGGKELNYSSDIDLMFIYDKDGELTNGETYSSAFQRIAEEICRILNAQSEHGMLYRVDTRLRPDGTSGILCQSLSAYLYYYEMRGRLWERQMLLKARPIAGDRDFGGKALERLAPFIFPKTIQYPLHEIIGLREKSETQTAHGVNVKTDPGGIRDIEFIVQALQLQFGGQAPEIRSVNTVESLQNLAKDEKYLSQDESVTLQNAYKFLRNIEHSLQLQENRQIHELPESEPDNLMITAAINADNYQSLYQKTIETMQTVRTIYTNIFERPAESEDENFSKYSEEDWREYFASEGFANPEKAAGQIQSLATGRFPNNHDSQTRHAFWELCPALLDILHDYPLPAQTLTDFERIIRSYSAIGSVYRILSGNRKLLRLILDIISQTPKIVPWTIQQPGLLDTLLSYSPDPIPAEQFPEIYSPLAQLESPFEEWRKEALNVHHTLLTTIFSHWITETIDLSVAQKLFAKAYRCFLQASLDYRLDEYRDDLSVIVAGSAATDTMHFSSDIDAIFLIAPDADYPTIQQAVEKYIQAMQEYTAHGRLISFDFRLRPEGGSSPLIMPLNDYHNYISNRMSGWEFQAVQKARHLWGNSTVWESAATKINERIDSLVSSQTFWKNLIEWEQSVIRQKSSRAAQSFTYHPGGYFPVRNSLEWKSLLGIEDDLADSDTLHQAYRFFWKIRWHLSLFMEGSVERLPNDEKKRNHLAFDMGFENAERLEKQVAEYSDEANRINKEFRKKLFQKVS